MPNSSQRRTLQRHLDRLKNGDLVNAIASDGKNAYVILYSRQGKQPSFYSIHPPEPDGTQSWFPVHPGDPLIPKEYKEGMFPRKVINAWGEEELQYDSDEED